MNESARVESLRELLDRFDGAGAHFRESRRQFLLGVREAVLVCEELAEAYEEQAPVLRQLAAGLLLGRGALDFLLSRVPPMEGEDTARRIEIRLEAMGILRDLLVAELGRIDDAEEPGKKDGLLTVIGVIDQEVERLGESLDRAQRGDDSASADGSIDWIEVER